jgi:hypothetical protein
MENALSFLMREVTALSSAPTIFVTGIAAVSIAVWFVLDWAYKTRLSSKDGTIEILKATIDDYKRKLDGRSPDEVKTEIDRLQSIVTDAIGERWEPLSQSQSDRLVANLNGIPIGQLTVMYENQLGRALAQSIAAAFSRAGWSPDVTHGGALGIGVSTGRGAGLPNQLQQALESMGGLGPIGICGPTEPHRFLFVAVGIKGSKVGPAT